MRYKRGRRFDMPHAKQSVVYFICLNFGNLPKQLRREIRGLCVECGGDWHQAVIEAVTTERRLLDVAESAGSDFVTLTESGLLRMVRRFYGKFFELPYMRGLCEKHTSKGQVSK